MTVTAATHSSSYCFGQYSEDRVRPSIYDQICQSVPYLQAGCVVAIFAIGFFSTYHAKFQEYHDFPYAIARGAGMAIKLLLPLIFLPTLRMIHAKAYRHLPYIFNNRLTKKIFHLRISFHKFLAEALITSAAIHTTAHSYRRLTSFASQESITGTAMLAFVTLPIASMYLVRSYRTTLVKWTGKQSYYRQFMIPHQIGWWGVIAAYGVHTQDLRLLPWAMGCFGLFSLDRLWEWSESKDIAVKRVEKIHSTMVLIEFETPCGYVFKTGQKVYLAYPAKTAFFNKLHPFTIASSPKERVLRFVISVTGKWTSHLICGLKEGEKMRLSPPFPSELDGAKMESERLLITTGSGIAMSLAHLCNSEDKSPVRIIHTSRNPEEFDLINGYLKTRSITPLSVEYHDTSGSMRENTSVSTTYVPTRVDPKTHPLLKTFEGRIYYCGNEDLGNAVEQMILKRKKVVFLRERFEF
jgi:ferredoxin-NADP reductase